MMEEDINALLAGYARAPEPETLNRLTEHFLPLSRQVAAKFYGRGAEMEDLRQVAAMALMNAIKRFDPDKGVKFTTFAVTTMAGEVRNHLRDKAALIRPSRDLREKAAQVNKITDRLAQQLLREPTVREIAGEMNITPDELLHILDSREKLEVASLNEISGEDDRALEERLGQTDGGYEAVEQRDMWQWIMRQLTGQEQLLVRLRYV
ncbi:MAG: sigma-70 family RNA polymerase sigma factor [Clostridia bacterium]|nr:sigma-70 family RNA polymerase sigma factor [Clostridia bacterium]